MRFFQRLLASSLILLTGCAVAPVVTQSPAPKVSNLAVRGKVHGGPPQNPIVGAQIYLYAVATPSTGAVGQASTSLLNSTGTSGNGPYYVTTDANGNFTIAANQFSCTSGQQLYLYSVNGNPQVNGGDNSAAGLMAVLGDCSGLANLPASVQMDEVTTVAAAYALAGFATDATHISGASTTPAIALSNAAASAGNLASLTTGFALATTPGGNGTVPQAEIDTLANILAACINSSGPGSGPCTALFQNAESGGSTGTMPTDTATAAINIAHNPGANVGALYNVELGFEQFNPALAGAPNDWTIAVTYTGGGLSGVTELAVDGSGNVWVTNSNNNSVSKFSALGVPQSPSTGYTGSLNNPFGIAISGAGNVWVTNANGSTISEFSNSGGVLYNSASGYGGLNNPLGIAIDGNGHLWVANHGNSSTSQFDSSGTVISGSPFSGGGLNDPDGIALDNSGHVWTANFGASPAGSISEFGSSGAISGGSGDTGGGLNAAIDVAVDTTNSHLWVANNAGNSISEFDLSGNAISGGSGDTGGGLSSPHSIAVDGFGNVWVANDVYPGSISEFSNTGSAITGSNGYIDGRSGAGLSEPVSIAVDGSGDVWVADDGNSELTEFVGAAGPVITPTTVTAPPLSITTTSLPNGMEGTPYSTTLAANGGTTPYTWSLTSGTLPSNLSLNTATGLISGTPEAAVSATPLTFKVTDANSQSQSVNLTLTITSGTGMTVAVTPQQAGITTTQTLSLIPTTNDGAGVDWSASGSGCSGSGCGTFSAANTTNGVAVVYTPPSTPGVYTITATSASETSVTASATVGVTNLAGVFTYHNDLSRDGANTQEYALTTTNVATATFGKLFSCTVDGAIYTQPLWVPNLTVNAAQHNVIFVATTNDSLYAFDADASPCNSLWHANLIDSTHGANADEIPVPSTCAETSTNDCVGQGGGDIAPEVGVIGTPVIDPSTNTLYVVSKSVVASGPTFYQRLHAIDITTGNEKFSGPVVISGTYPGTGDGGTTTTFSARAGNQRTALALANGVVYIAWASHEDKTPYYGWVIGYNASDLTQASVFNDTPNKAPHQGGIWMSGAAPAVDTSGYLYLLTGNGSFDASSGTAPNNDYGDSMLKLTSGLTVNQYFTPSDQNSDNTNDMDFGSGGATVLVSLSGNGGTTPTCLAIGGGKDGYFYSLNCNALGGSGNANAWQRISAGNGVFSTGAFWNSTYYLGAQFEPIQAWSLSSSTAKLTAVAARTATTYSFPGPTPSISSTPTLTNGIVWALDNSGSCPPEASCAAAVLHAYSATSLSTELWNSTMGTGNAAGNAVKFTVPTVANGKVYVGTRGSNQGGSTLPESGELDVYGLLPN